MPESLLKFLKYFLILAFLGILTYALYERVILDHKTSTIWFVPIPLVLLFMTAPKFFLAMRGQIGLWAVVCIAPFLVIDLSSGGLEFWEILFLLGLLVLCYFILHETIGKIWKKLKG